MVKFVTDTKSSYIPLKKEERAVVQIEMYTEYLDEYCTLFISALSLN